jgi:hypothetical protein
LDGVKLPASSNRPANHILICGLHHVAFVTRTLL